jgi:hypothetical protein
MKTKITKISAVDNPLVPTASVEQYECGHLNDLSPFDGYWVTGKLVKPIVVGESILLERDCRNGVKVDGMFVSSTVKKTGKNYGKLFVFTDNSIYRVEEV